MEERDTWEFPVVGTPHIPGAMDLAHRLGVGDTLTLVHEPSNRHDPHAVRVERDEMPIGYVPSRGCSCSRCWSPVTTQDNWCQICGAPYEAFVKGGMARRILERGLLQKDHVCFVSKKDEESGTAPVYATLITR